MAKVSGAYHSLSRGVNQQPFEARLDGQHGEQVNMWSDPVHGLTRRRGTLYQGSVSSNLYGPSYFQRSEFQQQEYRTWLASFRTISYTVGSEELLVHYPSKPRPLWLSEASYEEGAGISVTRKISGAHPLAASSAILTVSTGASGVESNAAWAAISKGFSGAVQVGEYVVLVPNNTVFTVPQEINWWANAINKDYGFEIRQGMPNRKYTLTAMVDGVLYTSSYTTPSSSYSGTLDTSDIPFSDPEYQKKVNDRLNAYNDAVTKWITTAAQETRPAYIASRLATFGAVQAAVAAVGGIIYHAGDTSTSGAFAIDNVTGRVTAPTLTDGGSGSTVTMTNLTVTSTDALPSRHLYGHIVQIKPERGTASYYVQAVGQGAGAWGPVRWEECPATFSAAINSPLLILALNPARIGTALDAVGVARGTVAGLAHLSSTIGSAAPNSIPQFNSRLVGDEDSSPTPAFFNKQITWVGMFQDRLAFAAGGVLNFSEVGNYFNFWRTQTLTVPDNDPVEVYALGSEADTIRYSVIFDRSLLLFGDNQQYSIDGRNPLTPSTSSIIQSSAVEDATDCPPVVGRDLVFFAKRREGSTEVFQMEVGDVSDTSRFTGLGMQLSDYIRGKPAQLLYVSSPSMLLVRTDEMPHSIYVFRFIDHGNERIMDSWSRFDYAPAFGLIYSMFYHEDSVHLRVAREAWKDENGIVWTGANGYFGYSALEKQSLLPQVPGVPYLDSMRRADSLWVSGMKGVPTSRDWWDRKYPFLATVFTRDRIAGYLTTDPAQPKNAYWLHGVIPCVNTLADFNATFAYIPAGLAARHPDWCALGLPFESSVELTSPVRRSQSGQPIMQGRLTVNRLDVYYKDAGGFSASVTSRYGIAEQHNDFDWVAVNTDYGTITSLRFNGRILGMADNMVGVIPVTSGSTPVHVGREVKDYTCTITSRSWMPLSITRITWTGQWFMNHRFV